MQNYPIGVFDSGVGGLSVWREIVTLLPNESTVFVGDSKRAPYGRLSSDEIYHYSKRITEFLLASQAKLIVIACNTSTVSCLDVLRSDFRDIPIIGTVPVIKTAAAVTKNKKIGVLATVRTAESHFQKHLIEEFASHCEVTTVGTNKLVPFIEKGEITTDKFLQVLKQELEPFSNADVDTIVLGSTHFAFIEQQIADILGKNVQLLDSGAAIARQVKRVLEHNNALSEGNNPTYSFNTTGTAKQFEIVAKRLLGETFSDKIKSVKNISV